MNLKFGLELIRTRDRMAITFEFLGLTTANDRALLDINKLLLLCSRD